MLLDVRLEGVIEVREQYVGFAGRPYWEVSLISDDGQTLHVHEGQLKETGLEALEIGRRYRVTFRPFVNNRWIELKLQGASPVGEEEQGM